ncbi:reverse transcriptase domain-containing protein, partial [Tanacetum coccineum]
SARRSTKIEVWIKKLQENAKINTRNQNASLKNLETQIEQLTKEFCSRKEKSEQAKVVIVEREGPSSPKKIKNLHGISFLSDSQEEKLPTKESNLGHFTLPCTIGNFNFYAMADLGASVNVLPRNIFEYLELTNLSETEILVEMADMRKKAPLGIVRDILVKIDKFLFPSDFVILDQTLNSIVILGRPFLATVHAQISVFKKEISVGIGYERVKDSVWSERYSEWCNKNSHDEKPRPRDYTFKEWFTEALDPDKDPLERCFVEYNWVFHKEIEQLADEYEIKIREKGQVLEEIWTKCKKPRCKNKDWWYNYRYEDEEKTELGSEDYNPPMVHTKTFEVTKYKFDNGCSFICVSGENNETLSLGRKNESRFRKMIMEEMEEVLGNDREDSDDETIQQLGGNYRDRLDLKLCGNLVESGIKSLREDRDNLKDFRQISNLEAMLKEFLNGNIKVRCESTKGKDGVYRVLPSTTQEEQFADEKERKARTLLLMAVPKDHLRRFHGMDDAKEIWAAIKTRFGGNANSKKMQKAVLKQQFEAFTISSKESLEKGYDRFQKLLSQLDALGAGVSDEDANPQVF